MAEAGPCRCGRGTLYDVLQVSPWCEAEVIQAAYRALARTRHPDVNRDRDAEDQMRRLNVAYQTLSDPARRARYDEELVLESARSAIPRPASGRTGAAPGAAAANAAAAPEPAARAPRAAPAASAGPAYQAMMFESRSEGLLPRSALYLLVILITVILTMIVYVLIDLLAAERSISPQRGARVEESSWSDAMNVPPRSPASWLFESTDRGAGPGLSQPGERWNR